MPRRARFGSIGHPNQPKPSGPFCTRCVPIRLGRTLVMSAELGNHSQTEFAPRRRHVWSSRIMSTSGLSFRQPSAKTGHGRS